MYKIDISSNSGIDLAAEYNSQKSIINHFNGVFTVLVTKYNTNDDSTTVFYGDYFTSLSKAKVMSIRSDKVSTLLKEKLDVSDDTSIVIFDEPDDILDKLSEDELINVANNISNIQYIKSLFPCNVDYIAFVGLSSKFSDIMRERLRYECHKRIIIGYRDTEVFISKVQ